MGLCTEGDLHPTCSSLCVSVCVCVCLCVSVCVCVWLSVAQCVSANFHAWWDTLERRLPTPQAELIGLPCGMWPDTLRLKNQIVSLFFLIPSRTRSPAISRHPQYTIIAGPCHDLPRLNHIGFMFDCDGLETSFPAQINEVKPSCPALSNSPPPRPRPCPQKLMAEKCPEYWSRTEWGQWNFY